MRFGRAIVMCAALAAARAFAADPQPWPLTLTLHDEGLGMPGIGGEVLFRPPFYPGVRAGTEYTWLTGGRLELDQTAELAWAHGGVDSLVGITTHLALAVRLFEPVALEGQLGVGLWFGFWTRRSFDSAGAPTVGTWSVAPSGRLAVVVTLPWGPRPAVVAGYEARLGVPLGPGSLLPRSSLFLGVRFPLGTP